MIEEKLIDSGDPSLWSIGVPAASDAQADAMEEFDASALAPSSDTVCTPPLTQAELVQLHIRVIALENLVIALLAQAPDCQLVLAREMATYITPRPGFTPHSLTIGAANEMLSLVNRAAPFRATATANSPQSLF